MLLGPKLAAKVANGRAPHFQLFGFQAFRIFQREMSCHFLWPMPFYWRPKTIRCS